MPIDAGTSRPTVSANQNEGGYRPRKDGPIRMTALGLISKIDAGTSRPTVSANQNEG